jgi:hypothetical protein
MGAILLVQRCGRSISIRLSVRVRAIRTRRMLIWRIPSGWVYRRGFTLHALVARPPTATRAAACAAFTATYGAFGGTA